jgi:phage baseplate assembly protein W
VERPDLGTDIQLQHRLTLGSALQLETVGGDLVTTTGLDNLSQALWLRLGVPRGDLTNLGHPDFGSRLHLLIGRLATPETLALARAYVREALRREPRIAEVSRVDVAVNPVDRGELLIAISLRPVGKADPIDLSLTFALEPGQVEATAHAAAGR